MDILTFPSTLLCERVQSIVFESLNIQAGMDGTGVPTKMLSLNSTVRISFRNTATFFGVHVSSTPITLYYYDLKVASGNVSDSLQFFFMSFLCTIYNLDRWSSSALMGHEEDGFLG